MGDASKTPTPKNNAARDMTDAHVSVDQAPRLKGVDLRSIFWSIFVVALGWVVLGGQ